MLMQINRNDGGVISIKIAFVSNYFNHHQKPFCEEMYKCLGTDFTFISTAPMSEERMKLGYTQDFPPAYVHIAYENERQLKDAISLINNADVVIAGATPNRMLIQRIRNRKLLLRYSERPFKKEISLSKKIYHSFHFRQKDLWKKNVYMLCASAYAAEDYASVGMYKNRTYKWGYFPEVKEYDIDILLAQKKRNTLMWCGRYIDWKHPDDAVRVAHKLKNAGYDFQLNFVGTGVMEEELHRLSQDLGVEEHIRFLGSMPPEMVRTYMEETSIYLFTSDRQEGWGAVLNESMNSGCAIVASHAIGSVPFLIKHKENGLVYESGNVDDLFDKVKYLLDNYTEQDRMGKAAHTTVAERWNAKLATERLLKLTKELKDHGFCELFEDGPGSKAEII